VRSLAAALALLAGNAAAQAQVPFVKSYNLADGLASSTVYCAYQDAKGFMWFGTDAGVSRFDGRVFENFSLADGLAASDIVCLFEDTRGRLWTPGANGRLSYFDGQRFRGSGDTLLDLASSQAPFYAVAEDTARNVWFSTEAGELIRLDPAGGVARFDIPVRRLPVHPDFYFTSDNEFWILTEDRFYKFEDDAFVPLIGPQLEAGSRLAYHFISKGNALYLSDKGLERLINKNYGVIIPRARLPFIRRDSRVHYNAENDIWLSDGESATAWFNYEKGNYGPYRYFARDLRVLSFFNDNERNTWICTDGNGLRCVSSRYTNTFFYTRADGLSGHRATAVTRDADSALWVGFNIGAIDRIGPSGVASYRYAHTGKSGILALETGADGSLWAFAQRYLVYIRRLGPGRYAPPRVLGPGIPYGDKIQGAWKAGGALFFHTATVVCRVDGPGNLRQAALADAPVLPAGSMPAADALLFGAGNGVYAWAGDTVSRLALDAEIRFPVTGLLVTADSLLAVATRGEGLLFFSRGRKVQQLTSWEGADLRFVNRLASREAVYLAATNNGLLRFITQNGKVSVLENFRTGDGLPSDVVNDVHVDSAGMVLAGDVGRPFCRTTWCGASKTRRRCTLPPWKPTTNPRSAATRCNSGTAACSSCSGTPRPPSTSPASSCSSTR
jgi:ligand-binding sensor domain-containing protein